MKFIKHITPGTGKVSFIPDDIDLQYPLYSDLSKEELHFLAYIPWNNKYLKNVPDEFKDLFIFVLPHLHKRTTDVHTAISMSFLDKMINKYSKESVNRRIVATSLILHDSGWSKLTDLEIAHSLGVKGLRLNEAAVSPKEKHAKESVKITKQVLSKYNFEKPFSNHELDLIYTSIFYHDKPEKVQKNGKTPPEVKLLVDLDHIWSFTYENFWQDTVRKSVEPFKYLENLRNDLDSYFVTKEGKALANKLLDKRAEELEDYPKQMEP